jgi:hypothetical protein
MEYSESIKYAIFYEWGWIFKKIEISRDIFQIFPIVTVMVIMVIIRLILALLGPITALYILKRKKILTRYSESIGVS